MKLTLNFKRAITAVSGLSLLAILSGWLFQQATASACYTKLGFSFVGSVLVWLIMIFPVKFLVGKYDIDAENYKKRIVNHIGIGFTFAIANLLITALVVNIFFSLFFQCVAVSSFLEMVMSNNIIPHFLSYWVILAFVLPKNSWNSFGEKFASIYSPKTHLENNNKIKADHEIWIKENNQKIKIPCHEIRWIKADNNCVQIHTQDRKYLLYQSLKSMEEKLSDSGFIRIHRSTLLNLNAAKKYINKPSGDGEVELQDGLRLKFSRNYKNNIKDNIPMLI